MKDEYKFGAVLALIGTTVGMVGFFLFVQIHNPLITTMVNSNRAYEGESVRYTFAVLGYLTIAAGALWTLALYGFLMLPYARRLLAEWASGKEMAGTAAHSADVPRTIGVMH